MTRIGVVFWIGLVLASGFTTFKVKHSVQAIDDELTRVRKHAVAEQQEIRVLAAEWTYLNQPDRLAGLNRIYLQLAPLTARQLQQRAEDIAWRAPPAGLDILVAATSSTAGSPGAISPAAVYPAVGSPAAVSSDTVSAAAEIPPAAAPPDGGVPAGETRREAGDALAAAIAMLGGDAAAPALRLARAAPAPPQLRLAKAAPGSLDALIAQIAESR